MAEELNGTDLRENLVTFVENLLETPEDATFFCVKDQIKRPEGILREEGLPEKELHFNLNIFRRLLKGILDFPNEYIKIKVG